MEMCTNPSRYRQSLAGMVIVDVDNLGRVQGVELLDRSEVFRRYEASA